MEDTKDTKNIEVIFFCKGECGKVDMKGQEKITPPELNICFGCKHKEQEKKETTGPIPLK